VGVHVVREAARTADPGDEDEVLACDTELGQHLLDLRQDGVVPAARAPADILIRDEVLLREPGGFRRAGRAHAASSLPFTSPLQPATISETLNGRPWILLKPIASTRYSARNSRTSCPRFISGTRTRR